MSFASIGLAGLQFYWIYRAIDINSARFRSAVHSSMNEVAHKIEQKEVLYLTQRVIKDSESLIKILNVQETDSLSTPIDELREGTAFSIKSNTPEAKSLASFEIFKDSISHLARITVPRISFPLLHLLDSSLFVRNYYRQNRNWFPRSPIFLLDTMQQLLVGYKHFKEVYMSREGQGLSLNVRRVPSRRDLSQIRNKYPYYPVWVWEPGSSLRLLSSYRGDLGNEDKGELNQRALAESLSIFKEPEMSIDQALVSPSDASSRTKIKSRKDIKPMLSLLEGGRQSREKKPEVVKIVTKSDLISFVLDELQRRRTDFRDKLNQKRLDSLLKESLSNRGISIDYSFMVENRQDRKNPATILFCNDYQLIKKMKGQGYKVKLFPTEVFASDLWLYVYFPDTLQVILKNMGWVFLSSLILLGLVIYCFAQAVRTIIRQKKMSEITQDFINNMTHELKTPISTVSLACEAIQDPDMRNFPRQIDRYMSIIKEENDRLGRQVERVLQIAVLDRGDFKLKIQSINLHEVIEQAIRNIWIHIENREGSIETLLQAENPVLEVDEVHISNVIFNLLDNANKYSPEPPLIQVRTQDAPGGINLAISDQGQGMSKETINKIFDKFYRVPTGNVHDVKGFGLGLSYVRTIINTHGGHISVKSELGKGSTFTLFIPHQFQKRTQPYE